MIKREYKSVAGIALLEYALIIGVVVFAFFAMNVYIKRGVQGRVKGMTDLFIGDGEEMQEADANPTATSSSNSNTDSRSTFTTEELLSGGRRIGLEDTTVIEATGTSEDWKKPIVPDPSVTAGEGVVPPVPTTVYQPNNAGRR